MGTSEKYVAMPEDGWLEEEEERGVTYLVFPHAKIKQHGAILKKNGPNSLTALRIIEHESCDSDSHAVDKAARSISRFENVPILTFPYHHSSAEMVPVPQIASKITSRFTRWGEEIRGRGDVQYLSGFVEWMREIFEVLRSRETTRSISTMLEPACYEYCRPDGMYRALCELWCPETNTFLTSIGEIGISLSEIYQISGCSMSGQYYQERVPNLFELFDCEYSPSALSYLFKAFAIIAASCRSDRVRHFDWIDFWFRGYPRAVNSQKADVIRKAKAKLDKSGDIDRPINLMPPEKRPSGSRTSPFVLLGLSANSTLGKIVYRSAAMVLFLCKFALPWSGDLIRPGTFIPALHMVRGTEYNLAAPILCLLYNGLTRTYSSLSASPKFSGELGRASSFCPLHYLYGWIGLHFPRGIFAKNLQQRRFPFLVAVSGALAAYQPWEGSARDARMILRTMGEADFRFSYECRQVGDREKGIFYDNAKMPYSIFLLMLNCKPGFLVFRRGNMVQIAQYSPHRFSRQQGFMQMIPGTPIPYNEEVSPKSAFRHWLALFERHTGASFALPLREINLRDSVTSAYSSLVRGGIKNLLAMYPVSMLKSSEKNSFEFNKDGGAKDRTEIRLQRNSRPGSSQAGHRRTESDREAESSCSGTSERPIPLVTPSERQAVLKGAERGARKRARTSEDNSSIREIVNPLATSPTGSRHQLLETTLVAASSPDGERDINTGVATDGVGFQPVDIATSGYSVGGLCTPNDNLNEVISKGSLRDDDFDATYPFFQDLQDEGVGANQEVSVTVEMATRKVVDDSVFEEPAGPSMPPVDFEVQSPSLVCQKIQAEVPVFKKPRSIAGMSPAMSEATGFIPGSVEEMDRSLAAIMLIPCRSFIDCSLKPFHQAGFSALEKWWTNMGAIFCDRLRKFGVNDSVFVEKIESLLQDSHAYHNRRSSFVKDKAIVSPDHMAKIEETLKSFSKFLNEGDSALSAAESEETSARLALEEAKIAVISCEARLAAASGAVALQHDYLNSLKAQKTEKEKELIELKGQEEAGASSVLAIDGAREKLMQRLRDLSSIY